MTQTAEVSLQALAEKAKELAHKISNNLEVIDPDNNLGQLQQHLEIGSAGINFAPHLGIDPLVASLFYRKHFRNPAQWIASAKYNPQLVKDYNLENMGFPVQGAALITQMLDIALLHVFQPDIYDSLPPELRPGADMVNGRSLREAKKAMSQAGQSILILPEGTRNKTGGFAYARRGNEFLLEPVFKQSAPTGVLPVLMRGVDTLYDPRKPGLEGLNSDAELQVVVGPFMTREQIYEGAKKYGWANQERPFTVDDYIMLQMAELGPQEILPGVDPRGVYAPKNIVWNHMH